MFSRYCDHDSNQNCTLYVNLYFLINNNLFKNYFELYTTGHFKKTNNLYDKTLIKINSRPTTRMVNGLRRLRFK